jgi:hypothetical protein
MSYILSDLSDDDATRFFNIMNRKCRQYIIRGYVERLKIIAGLK